MRAKKNVAVQVARYWTRHNVTQHKIFSSRQQSLDYFHWRCDQYPGYLELMPVAGFDGLRVLDYGCGPGHDLIGFLEYSRPERLVGADVSPSSLKESERRLALHEGQAELVLLDPVAARLPFDDQCFDYIHASGVLHHVQDLQAALRECSRILHPGGKVRVMVYHYDSLWLHLYVAYILRYKKASIPAGLPVREAFSRSTDGAECPIARCYTFEEFGGEAARAGFSARRIGVACALFEMDQCRQYLYQACMDERLEREHREFLLALTFNERQQPCYRGIPAGINLIIELTPA